MQSINLPRSLKLPGFILMCLTKSHITRCLVILLLLVAGTGVVYSTGGTAYAYPYLMLIPVLLGASWYQVPGSLITGLAAGICMAFMPQETNQGVEQSLSNSLLRIALYLLLGGVAGCLAHSRRHAFLIRHKESRTDHHSGLANEVALHEDLKKYLSQLALTNINTAVIKVKITDISDVIEALGLEAADELMTEMSLKLTRSIRGNEKAYRISSDELALIVTDIEPDDLEAISHRLLEIGEESILIRQVPVRVQFAIGSAIAKNNKTSQLELLREARIALLTSIRQRRGHTQFSPTFDLRSLESFKLIGRIRDGLEAKEFEVHYQPKIRLADSKICGCEGLIRWRGDSGKLIPPGQFMPKVENTSLIGPISYFVVQSASSFINNNEGETPVSINISVHNLHDEKLHALLSEAIEQTGLSPELLEVEITESALIGNIESARADIQRIRDLGIGVSIDDFGTGFASFEYLKHLPITGLKIDRTFVNEIDSDEKARGLMACMIEIGHTLDLVVTAEGVETPQQEQALRELGCDQAQGFLYSPALPPAEYHEWCREYEKNYRTILITR